MSVMMVRARVKSEHVADVEAAAGKLFAKLHQVKPQGLRYASSRLPDGVTFLVLLELADGSENPMAGLPEFQSFTEGLKNWVAEPPVPERLEVIGSYSLFG